ncbi:MAG: hypothetical protein LLG08_10135 [Actinomycetia bacterium]|nr:hypothetical protein [Actinomycetes bacterium]
MAIKTRATVNEDGTIIIDVAFFDEDEVACIPESAAWSLYDDNGTIINSRSDVAISPLADTVHIVLSGDDCQVLGSADSLDRILFIEWTYNSTLGSDLTGTEEVLFSVKNTIHGS